LVFVLMLGCGYFYSSCGFLLVISIFSCVIFPYIVSVAPSHVRV
jgi:hypothetical protein